MAMHSSIKLSAAFVEEVRREADVSHRSVGAQVEYWAKLGRAIENTPGFNVEHVRDAIEGRLRLDRLPPAESRPAFLAQVSAGFDNPDPETQAFYAALGERDGAVGTDGRGGVIRRTRPPEAGGPAQTAELGHHQPGMRVVGSDTSRIKRREGN